jgi:hypothetical protein
MHLEALTQNSLFSYIQPTAKRVLIKRSDLEPVSLWRPGNVAGETAMDSLLPLVRGYLESAGFKILLQQTESLVADKLVFGKERDTWVVWTVPGNQEVGWYEPILFPSAGL